MSGLLGVGEEIKVFKCPNCNEYISSKKTNCPKCSFEITNEMKGVAIKIQEEEVKESNRKFYRGILYAGIALFLIGGLMISSSMVSVYLTGGGRFWLWSPFLTLLGVGQIIYGLKGLREEK